MGILHNRSHRSLTDRSQLPPLTNLAITTTTTTTTTDHPYPHPSNYPWEERATGQQVSNWLCGQLLISWLVFNSAQTRTSWGLRGPQVLNCFFGFWFWLKSHYIICALPWLVWGENRDFSRTKHPNDLRSVCKLEFVCCNRVLYLSWYTCGSQIKFEKTFYQKMISKLLQKFPIFKEEKNQVYSLKII